jgi:hypothetical protein
MLFLKLSATLCQRSSYLFICYTLSILKCKPLIPIVWTYTGFSWVLRHRNHERKRKFYLFRGFTPHQISRQPIYLQAILSVKIHSAVQVTDLRPTFSPWNLVVPSCTLLFFRSNSSCNYKCQVPLLTSNDWCAYKYIRGTETWVVALRPYEAVIDLMELFSRFKGRTPAAKFGGRFLLFWW